MRHRIYWLLPDLPSARGVMNALLLARIEQRHLHFMAREGIDLSELHAASVLQSSDIISSAQWGLCIGTALGAATGATFAVTAVFDEVASRPSSARCRSPVPCSAPGRPAWWVLRCPAGA
jgi:hypothetical protein